MKTYLQILQEQKAPLIDRLKVVPRDLDLWAHVLETGRLDGGEGRRNYVYVLRHCTADVLEYFETMTGGDLAKILVDLCADSQNPDALDYLRYYMEESRFNQDPDNADIFADAILALSANPIAKQNQALWKKILKVFQKVNANHQYDDELNQIINNLPDSFRTVQSIQQILKHLAS